MANAMNGNPYVLVTGASGFLGTSLIRSILKNTSYNIFALTRRSISSNSRVKILENIDLSGKFDITGTLKMVECVIHCAGAAHKKINKSKSEEYYYRNNVVATEELFKQSVKAKVKHFIYISSIGVNGSTTKDKPFYSSDLSQPHNDYAFSKLKAENKIMNLSSKSNVLTKYTIVRPPLIYGKNAPGNFGLLLKFSEYNIPLPASLNSNKRAFIYIENLTDFLIKIILNTKAYEKTFLVSDRNDISTLSLIKLIKKPKRKSVYTFCFPRRLIGLTFILLGKKSMFNQLFSNLEMNIEDTISATDWTPIYSIEEAIKEIVETN